MTWKPIVAGVDASPEGLRAALVAARLAQTARTSCYLVHGVRQPWTPSPIGDALAPVTLPVDPAVYLDSSRALLLEHLRGTVPASALDDLDVRMGISSVAVEEVAEERDAELIVLGGKHHTAIGRWLAGSTAHHLVRRLDCPLLVVDGKDSAPVVPFRKVLAAVDLSRAAAPVIDMAERMARLCGASLRVLHALEPLPIMPEIPASLERDVFERAEEELEQNIWPRVTLAGADRITRRGMAAPVVAEVASEWDADLVVLGTHGRGWVDRILIGSVTERLLNALPTSLLVVPISAPTATPTVRKAGRARSARPASARPTTPRR